MENKGLLSLSRDFGSVSQMVSPQANMSRTTGNVDEEKLIQIEQKKLKQVNFQENLQREKRKKEF